MDASAVQLVEGAGTFFVAALGILGQLRISARREGAETQWRKSCDVRLDKHSARLDGHDEDIKLQGEQIANIKGRLDPLPHHRGGD